MLSIVRGQLAYYDYFLPYPPWMDRDTVAARALGDAIVLLGGSSGRLCYR